MLEHVMLIVVIEVLTVLAQNLTQSAISESVHVISMIMHRRSR